MNLGDAEALAMRSAAQVATRLLHSAMDRDASLRSDPSTSGGWLDPLLSRCPPDLLVTEPAPALAIGCGWALLEAVSIIADGCPGKFDPGRVIDFVTSGRARLELGWRGYVRTSYGWISLALGPDDRETWRSFCEAAACSLMGSSAAEIATDAQQWGFACVPVAPATDGAAWHGKGSDASPPPQDPGILLGLADREPLSGVSVLDLGALVSAPLTCAILQALGAQVTAIGHSSRIGSRWYGNTADDVDFNTPSGRSRLGHLCSKADLVVDNFSPRVWRNFGFDPIGFGAKLHVRLPAFGADDPRRHHRAYGFQTEALFGVGCVPNPDASPSVRAPQLALMDHCVALATSVVCLGAIAAGRSGIIELAHSDVAALVR